MMLIGIYDLRFFSYKKNNIHFYCYEYFYAYLAKQFDVCIEHHGRSPMLYVHSNIILALSQKRFHATGHLVHMPHVCDLRIFLGYNSPTRPPYCQWHFNLILWHYLFPNNYALIGINGHSSIQYSFNEFKAIFVYYCSYYFVFSTYNEYDTVLEGRLIL